MISAQLLMAGPGYGQGEENKPVSLHFVNVPIEKVFAAIEKKASVILMYERTESIRNTKVSIGVTNMRLSEVLDRLLKDKPLQWSIRGKYIRIETAPVATVDHSEEADAGQAPGQPVSGKVVDADGRPLAGASVRIRKSGKGVATDGDGRFTLRDVEEGDTVEISAVGYAPVRLRMSQEALSLVRLSRQSSDLDEAVVTALGITRSKRTLSYSTEEVKMEPLTEVRDPTLATSFQGRLAGVSVSNASGATGVGSSSRIIIRGNRSINGNNQPLIVVDGVPYDNGKSLVGSATGNWDVVASDGLSNINPDDVESINVLKGPAAAALYGSAANNGVLLITTKKARSGAPQVQFNSIATVDLPYMYPDLQNEYGQGTGGQFSTTASDGGSWGAKMDGKPVLDWTGKQQPFSPQPNNVRDLFEKGYNLMNSLSYSAGTEKSTVYFSYANTTAKGLIPTDKLQRNNFDLRVTAKLLPKLNLDFKITYFTQNMANRFSGGDNYFSPMENLLKMPRNLRTADLEQYEYYTPDGSLKQRFWNPDGSVNLCNPYWAIYRRVAPTTRDRITSFVRLKYDLTDWLYVQGRVSLDNIHDDAEEKIYWDALYINAGKGNYYTAFSNQRGITGDAMVNFHKNLRNGLELSALVGGEFRDNKGRSQSSTTNGLTVENQFALNYGAANTTTDRQSETQIHSFYGTAQVGYKSMIYLDATARNDWNSTLPPPYDYFYPSVGLSAVLSDMVRLPQAISFAKLRASYAEVGNGVNFASIFQTFGRNTNGPIGQITTSHTKVAENLVPERSKSWEAGADLRFLQDRLSLEFTWYKSNTLNQLISIASPPTSGYSATQINTGNIQNTGIELMLSATPVKQSGFRWDTYLVFSRNRNKIKELYKGITRYALSIADNALANAYAEVGRPYGELYGHAFVRDAAGHIVVSNSGIPLMTAADSLYLGNFNYDWQSGLSNTFTYKRWRLSFLVDLSYGGVRQSGTEARLMASGNSKATLYGREGFIFDGVKQDGKPNDVTITAQQYAQVVGGRSSNGIPTELYSHSATNARLRELSIGYTFPLKSTGHVRLLHVSAVGRNLFFFYNACKWFDPDVTYDTNANGQGAENAFLPGTRTIGVNIKLSF